MAKNQSTRSSGFLNGVKKFLLSAFVVGTFIIYALHERNSGQTTGKTTNAPANPNQGSEGAAPPVTGSTSATIAPQAVTYRNGIYTGPAVDVFYGLVQVKVDIQNGQIANIQFIQYPNDRSTSREINSQAMPWLTQEAIQAQSANVDIITGATLTSEGFAMSLQAALASAKN